jgi:predicted signal transduction protein with EAL and GGDEF domain
VAPVVSVSVGVSSHGGTVLVPDEPSVQPPPTLERLVVAADEALYAAKKGGRRRAFSLALADQGHAERAVPTLAVVAPVPAVESRRA